MTVAIAEAAILTRLFPVSITVIRRSAFLKVFSSNSALMLLVLQVLQSISISDIIPVSELEKS